MKFFVRSIEEDKSTKNIINVLSALDDFIINRSVSKTNEIVEFGNYFHSNGYEKQTRKARENEFQEEAFILNKYYEIEERRERQLIQETIRELSYQERQEAFRLTDVIFDIKESKIITLCLGNSETIEFTYKKVLKQNEVAPLRFELFSYVAYAIHKFKSSEIVIRIMKRSDKPLLAGISIKNKKWRPLRVYEFMESVDKLDLNVRYTELPMRK